MMTQFNDPYILCQTPIVDLTTNPSQSFPAKVSLESLCEAVDSWCELKQCSALSIVLVFIDDNPMIWRYGCCWPGGTMPQWHICYITKSLPKISNVAPNLFNKILLCTYTNYMHHREGDTASSFVARISAMCLSIHNIRIEVFHYCLTINGILSAILFL